MSFICGLLLQIFYVCVCLHTCMCGISLICLVLSILSSPYDEHQYNAAL
jgi:hypothetical protein